MGAALYQDETTCKGCEQPATRTVVQGLPGTKPATLVDCPRCDRSKCQQCSGHVVDRRTRYCPGCRAPLQFAG